MTRLLLAALAAALAAASTPAAQAAVPIPAGNVLANPSFEEDVAGWGGFGTVIRVEAADAPDGRFVAEVRPNAPGTASSITDGARNLGARRRGDLGASRARFAYAAVAHVKGTAATAGRPVVLVVRETRPDGRSTFVGSTEVPVTLQADRYVRVRARHIAQATGNRIDVYAYRPAATLVAGDAFRVDALTLVARGPFAASRSTLAGLALPYADIEGLLRQRGSRLRTMVVQDTRHADVPRLRTRNPRTHILVYKNSAATLRERTSPAAAGSR